jgi:MinD-like ATPase involved in chromosome partitioning or flagellar assembly
MNKGTIIAVWGNNGSGKTTLSIKLASKLAAMKKEVIVILTDITAPDMSVILPKEKKTRSMGSIWSTPDCSIDAIYKSCVITDSDYICLLGYKNGENVFSNPDYTKDNIVDVLTKLTTIVDYVIIDCVSDFPYNVLSTVALEVADKVIRLQEATSKAFSFFNSNMNLLLDSRYRCNEHIKVLSKIKPGQAKDTAIHHFGGGHLELPYLEEVERQMLEGELFSLPDTRTYKVYNDCLDQLLKSIDDQHQDMEKKAEGKSKLQWTKIGLPQFLFKDSKKNRSEPTEGKLKFSLLRKKNKEE